MTRISYWDVQIPLPYPIEGNPKNLFRLKIPAQSILDVFLWLELNQVNIDFVEDVRVYDCTKIVGNTRYDFLLRRQYTAIEVSQSRIEYKRSKNRRYKEIISK